MQDENSVWTPDEGWLAQIQSFTKLLQYGASTRLGPDAPATAALDGYSDFCGSKLQAAVQCALFATLGSGSWLTVSSLFNQLVVMLPHIEPSRRGYIFSLMNVAIQASKLPALVYASRKLTASVHACRNSRSQPSSIPPGTQALRLCGTFS